MGCGPVTAELERQPAAAASRFGRGLRRPWYVFWRNVERIFYEGHDYTVHVPFGQRVYTPWFAPNGSPFAEAMARVRAGGPVAVSVDRCHLLYQLARSSLRVPGAFAECGVFSGGTAHLLALVLAGEKAEGRPLHLFDTFSGMPELAEPSRDYHRPGDFSGTSVEAVRARLAYPTSRFHPGVMPDTFSEVAGVEPYAFVHVDVDIYDSALECCRWFWPRMAKGGVMVFDDYGFYPYRRAARAAVDAYFQDQPLQPVVLPTGQAFAINLP
jgi:O-methyltransferase